MFFHDMCFCASICMVLFFHKMGSHPCHFYVQGFSSFKGEIEKQWTMESNVLWYIGNFTLIIIIFRNFEIFKMIKIRRKKKTCKISWIIPYF
jgi:ABC-type lipoprotein release transport system permease subunit